MSPEEKARLGIDKKLEAAEADLRVVSRRMAGYALEEI